MKTTPLHIACLTFEALGEIWLAASEKGLLTLQFPATREEFSAALQREYQREVVYDPEGLSTALQQLRAYLEGNLRQFTLPIDWEAMTPFQRMALRETLNIPYGQTRTYGQLAAALGKPGASRAIGRAEATNPLPLLIPCHRVLGSDGGLHGYGAGQGLSTKQWLLDLEQKA